LLHCCAVAKASSSSSLGSWGPHWLGLSLLQVQLLLLPEQNLLLLLLQVAEAAPAR
jgi:hypothetical protein